MSSKGFILDKIGKPNKNIHSKNLYGGRKDRGWDGIRPHGFGFQPIKFNNFCGGSKPFKFNNNFGCNFKPIQCGPCWQQPDVVYYKRPEKDQHKEWLPSRKSCLCY